VRQHQEKNQQRRDTLPMQKQPHKKREEEDGNLIVERVQKTGLRLKTRESMGGRTRCIA